MTWLPRAQLDGAFGAASDDFLSCRMRFEGAMAALGPEGFLLAAARRHGVNMSQADIASHVIAIVRPQGKAAPPAGFICGILANMLKQAAIATRHMNESAMPRGTFHVLAYKGRAAEGAFAKDVPTCSRLIVENPSNVVA